MNQPRWMIYGESGTDWASTKVEAEAKAKRLAIRGIKVEIVDTKPIRN